MPTYYSGILYYLCELCLVISLPVPLSILFLYFLTCTKICECSYPKNVLACGYTSLPNFDDRLRSFL